MSALVANDCIGVCGGVRDTTHARSHTPNANTHIPCGPYMQLELEIELLHRRLPHISTSFFLQHRVPTEHAIYYTPHATIRTRTPQTTIHPMPCYYDCYVRILRTLNFSKLTHSTHFSVINVRTYEKCVHSIFGRIID